MQTVFAHRLEVRFNDCDPMGHVNNAVYLTYLEQARFAHWRAFQGFALEAEVPRSPGIILARAEIDYRKPARYGDRLEIRLGIGRIGRTSFTYEYEVWSDTGELVAAATTVQVVFDYAAGRPVPLPDAVRSRIAQPIPAA